MTLLTILRDNAKCMERNIPMQHLAYCIITLVDCYNFYLLKLCARARLTSKGYGESIVILRSNISNAIVEVQGKSL